VHAGFLDVTRCNALRVTIRSNEQALLLQQAAGHTAEVTALRTKLATDLRTAQGIDGCDVRGLPSP
jgi:hypothetical protein